MMDEFSEYITPILYEWGGTDDPPEPELDLEI